MSILSILLHPLTLLVSEECLQTALGPHPAPAAAPTRWEPRNPVAPVINTSDISAPLT